MYDKTRKRIFKLKLLLNQSAVLVEHPGMESQLYMPVWVGNCVMLRQVIFDYNAPLKGSKSSHSLSSSGSGSGSGAKKPQPQTESQAQSRTQAQTQQQAVKRTLLKHVDSHVKIKRKLPLPLRSFKGSLGHRTSSSGNSRRRLSSGSNSPGPGPGKHVRFRLNPVHETPATPSSSRLLSQRRHLPPFVASIPPPFDVIRKLFYIDPRSRHDNANTHAP